MRNLDLHILPRKCEIDTNDEQVETGEGNHHCPLIHASLLSSFQLIIEWSDGHVAQYDLPFLRSRAFIKENFDRRRKFSKNQKRVLWDKSHQIRYIKCVQEHYR